MTKCGNCNKCKGKKDKKEEHHSDNKECHRKCGGEVDLRVDVCPTVRHTESRHKKTDFEIELDFKTTPHCCIREKHHQKTDKCRHTCKFIVDVDLDLCARSRVSKPHSPEAHFDLDIDVDFDTHCKLAKGPHDCKDQNGEHHDF
jgi:hypothetical protein